MSQKYISHGHMFTLAQIYGMRRLRDNIGWSRGKRRTGGSIARMFERLADLGFCTDAPFSLTDKGRAALEKLEK